MRVRLKEYKAAGYLKEKDDDDGLPDESPAKRKSKSKKKKVGDQGASASKTAPWATEAKEAGAAAAGVGVEAKSWPPPLQADVEQAANVSLMSCNGWFQHCSGASSSARRSTSTSRKHVASCASRAAEGVGQPFKECWGRGRLLL